MDKERCSFVLYTEYFEHVKLLSMEQRGILFTCVLAYVAGDGLPEMDGMTQMAFSFIKSRLDRDSAAYEDKIKKRSEAGLLGGRPKANESKQKQNNPDTVPVTVPVSVINKNILCKSADADALFERLWKLYPCKRGKAQVSKANKMHLLDIGFDELQRAIDRYKADLDNETWRKPQNGSTFFNSGYVDYLDANYDLGKKAKNTKKNSFNNFADQRTYDYEELEKQLLGN